MVSRIKVVDSVTASELLLQDKPLIVPDQATHEEKGESAIKPRTAARERAAQTMRELESEDELCRAIRRRGQGARMSASLVASCAAGLRAKRSPEFIARFIKADPGIRYLNAEQKPTASLPQDLGEYDDTELSGQISRSDFGQEVRW